MYPLRQRLCRFLPAPPAQSEDEQRQKFIAMVLLGGLAAITSLKMLYLVAHPDHLGFDQEEDSLVVGGCFLIIVAGLWYLARRGRYRWSVFGLLGILTAEAVRLTLGWSFELLIAELMYALVIVVAGVLLTIRQALIVSGGVALLLFAISYFQVAHHLRPRTDWLQQDFQMADAVGYIAILTIIALVSWLTNREINQSLRRARASEAELAKERNSLEAQVVSRTQKLHQAELKRIMQLERFAEFGRLSANLLHEVASPLTAASLNLQQFSGDQPQLVLQARKNLQQLERYVTAARKQLKTEGILSSFSVRREVAQVLSIVRPLARRTGSK